MLLKKFFSSFLLSFVIVITTDAFSQSVEIKDLDVIDFDSKNVGVISKNSKKIVYTFYMANQTKGKTGKEGVLHFFDDNLNEIKKLTLNFNKQDLKFRVKDNGKNVMLYYYDRKNQKNIYKIFTASGELIYTKEVPFERKGMWLFDLEANNEDIPVYPIANNGFLIYHYAKKTKMGYNFYYINEEEKKEWSYSSPTNCPDYKDASVVMANEKAIVIFDREFSTLFEKKTKKNLVVLNTQTGQEFFKIENDYQENPSYYTSAILTSNNDLVVLSEYYDVKNKFFEFKDFNNGYLFEKFDIKGKKIIEKKLDFNDVTFQQKIDFKFDENQKINSNLFFYDCYEYDGKLYFVSEKVERSNLVNNKAGALVRMNSTAVFNFLDYFILEIDDKLFEYNITKINKKPQLGYITSYVRRPLLNMFEMKFENDLNYISSNFENQNKYSLRFIEKEIGDKNVTFQIKKNENNNGNLSTNVLSKLELTEKELYRYRILPFNKEKVLSVKSYDSLQLSIH